MRVKVVTCLIGSGATLIESPLEDRLNEVLESLQGEVRQITQSESERPGTGHHVTICIWYVPDAERPQA